MNWSKIIIDAPRSIKTGYSLMGLAFILVTFLAAIGKLEAKPVYILVAGILVTALVGAFLLQSNLQQSTHADVDDICDIDLKSAVDCSKMPMYLTDVNLIVRHCNDRLLLFIGARPSEVLGKHVKVIVQRFAELVPEDRRSAFVKRQLQIIDEAEHGRYLAISEVVDLSKRVSAVEHRMFRVWIHADIVYPKDCAKEIGWLVYYHPVEVTKDDKGKLILLDQD
jgi:PAS domain-containing protein